ALDGARLGLVDSFGIRAPERCMLDAAVHRGPFPKLPRFFLIIRGMPSGNGDGNVGRDAPRRAVPRASSNSRKEVLATRQNEPQRPGLATRVTSAPGSCRSCSRTDPQASLRCHMAELEVRHGT